MSKITERALVDVEQSEFKFLDAKTLEVQNAVIFWTNFRGEPNRFGNAARTFNLAVTKEVAEILDDRGWKVRPYEPKEGEYGYSDNPEEALTLYYVNIKVNMDSAYPPSVTLFSTFKGKRSRRPLDKDTIGELDRIDIESCDCKINMYTSQMFPDKVTGYLKDLKVIQTEDVEYNGKYDDWMGEDES